MADEPYGQTHYAAKPTKSTLFFRTFLPWQIVRFLIVNVRMTGMILKSHDSHVGRQQPRRGADS